MDFSSMSGWDFERYCADCLLKKGFTKGRFPIRRCRRPIRVLPIMTAMLRSL